MPQGTSFNVRSEKPINFTLTVPVPIIYLGHVVHPGVPEHGDSVTPFRDSFQGRQHSRSFPHAASRFPLTFSFPTSVLRIADTHRFPFASQRRLVEWCVFSRHTPTQ